ncbi:PAS domain S-box protein [Methanoculleus sp.]|uniref:PAS domain S-box protein n=1 Tax=Methanoculleus sp. TaxID=90427 RepID=UPI0025CB846D|nr:PAS domain S-box protein [Methanoculleus sp.]MCK9317482.1 PAS domain S-box protein [Methanoculleus sp.]MDD2788138.1 PAS domain S-box protein [Methanoculleus sp.]MDD3215941.1 PAS domain S-box protein [Methanoculleus sp.]MDD4313691.1 PAS domain S-box protein [Methanoculleus sp.]MDD4470162.1 PAS domain S-box protein [Methanoculleus sp.]
MDRTTDALSLLLSTLKEHPRGMSVSDLAAAVGINRNTVSRYLDILLVSGRVEMETYGKAKVFYLSQRVPIAAMLNFSSDLVLVLDRERRIVQANDAVCAFAGRERDAVLGNSIEESPLAAFDHPLIRSRITDALNGREVTEELRFLRHDAELFFRIKFLPTVFNDGAPGVTIILEDITEGRRAEEALRESEMLFRSLVENINDLILNVDETCTFTYVSPKSRDILGYAPEEMLGKTPCDFMNPEKAESVRARFAALFADPEPKVAFEWTMHHRDGSHVVFDVSGTPVYDMIGDFTGYRVVCRDVTERVRATKRVAQWKSFLYSVVNNVPSMVFVREVEGNTFVFANRAAEIFLGMTQEEMTGKRAADLFPPEMAGFFADGDREMLERSAALERKVHLPTGASISMKKIPVFNSRGMLRYMLGIAEDITDRAAAEDLLVAERDRAQGYLDAAGVMIAVIGADGSIDLVNRKGSEILGYAEEDLAGRDWFATVVPERLRDRLTRNFVRLAAGEIEPPAFEESPVVTREGRERSILWHNALLRDIDGKVVAMVSSGEVVGE